MINLNNETIMRQTTELSFIVYVQGVPKKASLYEMSSNRVNFAPKLKSCMFFWIPQIKGYKKITKFLKFGEKMSMLELKIGDTLLSQLLCME